MEKQKNEDQFQWLEHGKLLWKRRKFIGSVTLIATLISVVISLIIPEKFKSTAVLMPLGGQKGIGLSAVVAQMGFGGILGDLGGGSNSAAQIMALLKSRTLAEIIIAKYELMPHLFGGKWDSKNRRWKDGKQPDMEEAVQKFFLKERFVEDKKNRTVTIHAIMEDPKVAAIMVNGTVDELLLHINRNTFTVAKKNRIFIEKQLERNKAELLDAGKELTRFYGVNKISSSVPIMDVDVGFQKEELDADKTEEEQVPQGVSNLNEKINKIDQHLERAKMVRDVPQQVYLQYLILRRDLLGKMNALLTQQYEVAKIEENKEDLAFQVIDRAAVAMRRDSPRRKQIVVTTFFISGLVAALYVVSREKFEKTKQIDFRS